MLGNINSETMRATNLQVIFDYIRRNEPASRRDIAEFGGLTVAAVSNITSKLLANGLVVEVGAGESVGGRRPTLLGINADCRYAVGIVGLSNILYSERFKERSKFFFRGEPGKGAHR